MGPGAGKPCSKQALLAALPLRDVDLCIRALDRPDLGALAGWPSYPAGWEGFNLRFARMGGVELDDLFQSRQAVSDGSLA